MGSHIIGLDGTKPILIDKSQNKAYFFEKPWNAEPR